MKLNEILSQPLLEMDWYEKSPMTSVLLRNRGKWIHFSQGVYNRNPENAKLTPMPDLGQYNTGGYGWAKRMKQYHKEKNRVERINAIQKIPKLSINPNSFHDDPVGIYFYPVDFLLSGTERIRSGQQYGLGWKYYYIVDINTSDPNGVILQKMTWDDVERIAKRNGWYEQMTEFRAKPTEEQKSVVPSYVNPNNPGSFFWGFVDKMTSDQMPEQKKIRWKRAYSGISFIQDMNGSIIHSNEPDQILVLDPRVIKIIEQGENKGSLALNRPTGDLEHWMYALTDILKAVRGELGGNLTWKYKFPSLTGNIGWLSFTIRPPERTTSEVSLYTEYKYGRAEGGFSIGYKTFMNKTQEQIVSEIVSKLKYNATKKTDLSFVPFISETDAKQILINRVGVGQSFEFSTKIHNEIQRNWCDMRISGKNIKEIDNIKVETVVGIGMSPDDFDLNTNVFMNGKSLFYGSVSDFQDKDEVFVQLTAKLVQSLEYHFGRVSPENQHTKSWVKWNTYEEFTAYKGWLILNCGLSVNGLLAAQFQDEISIYEALPDEEKRNLQADIYYKSRDY